MGLMFSLLLWGMEWLPHYGLIRVKGQILHIIATDRVQLLEAFCVVLCFVCTCWCFQVTGLQLQAWNISGNHNSLILWVPMSLASLPSSSTLQSLLIFLLPIMPRGLDALIGRSREKCFYIFSEEV